MGRQHEGQDGSRALNCSCGAALHTAFGICWRDSTYKGYSQGEAMVRDMLTKEAIADIWSVQLETRLAGQNSARGTQHPQNVMLARVQRA